jgi:RNA polymerase subunit RPABC4/transcription elongation factor Spt4
MDDYIALGSVAGGTVVALFWISLVIWTYRDIRDRSHDLAMQVLAVFLVMGFFLLGLLLYLILRPRETLDEAYARSLEEEALLRDLGAESACPSCRRFVEKDFLYCPYCQAQLREPCGRCGRPLSSSWIACPNCGTARAAPAPAARRARATKEATKPVAEGVSPSTEAAQAPPYQT